MTPQPAAERGTVKSVKLKNRNLVLNFLRNSQALSIAEIARTTRLSKMTVHKIVDYFLENKILSTAGKQDSTNEGGKRANLFSFNPCFKYIFSVQIFETSILAAITDLNANILLETRTKHEKNAEITLVLSTIRRIFDQLSTSLRLREEMFCGVAVGCNGITDAKRGLIITSPHFLSWGTHLPVRDMLREKFPWTNAVYVDNWIRYQAYAELKAGAARQLRRFLVIGTEADGTSGALVWDGLLSHGKKGLSGEIGHMIIAPDSQEKCACGGRGCLEALASLLNLEKKAREKADVWPKSLLFSKKSPENIKFTDIFSSADQGDDFACQLVNTVAGYFAIAINNVVQVCDPELIIIQGEYALAGNYFIQRLRDNLRQLSLLQMDKEIRVIYSSLGANQGIIGAAHYVADDFFGGSMKI